MTWPEAGGMRQAPALCGAACAHCCMAPVTRKGVGLGFCFSVACLGCLWLHFSILCVLRSSQQSSMSGRTTIPVGSVGPKGARAHLLPCARRGAQCRMENRYGTVLMVLLWLSWFEPALGRFVVPVGATLRMSCVVAVIAGAGGQDQKRAGEDVQEWTRSKPVWPVGHDRALATPCAPVSAPFFWCGLVSSCRLAWE